eukprot:5425954-Prymnesium_polylepis.3
MDGRATIAATKHTCHRITDTGRACEPLGGGRGCGGTSLSIWTKGHGRPGLAPQGDGRTSDASSPCRKDDRFLVATSYF